MFYKNPGNLHNIYNLPKLPSDGNPEALLMQSSLDGSENPTDTKLGDDLVDIIGVITYALGAYIYSSPTDSRQGCFFKNPCSTASYGSNLI